MLYQFNICKILVLANALKIFFCGNMLLYKEEKNEFDVVKYLK